MRPSSGASSIGSRVRSGFRIARPKRSRRRCNLERSQSGVAGVFNPATGKVEWKTHSFAGIAGVLYNPETKQIEWKQVSRGGVAGVYNPIKKRVEWKIRYNAGVAGVYNPIEKRVEWKIQYNAGVAGVFNPDKGVVEWKIQMCAGVAGHYNPLTKRVEWQHHMGPGMGAVYPFADAANLASSGSFYGDANIGDSGRVDQISDRSATKDVYDLEPWRRSPTLEGRATLRLPRHKGDRLAFKRKNIR